MPSLVVVQGKQKRLRRMEVAMIVRDFVLVPVCEDGRNRERIVSRSRLTLIHWPAFQIWERIAQHQMFWGLIVSHMVKYRLVEVVG